MRQIIQHIIRILDGTPAEYGRQERGQSVVELGLIMPILLVMLAGIAEMGWFTNNYLIALEATRVGSRSGTLLEAEGSPISWERESVVIEELDPDYTMRTRRGVYPQPIVEAGQDWYFTRDARVIDAINGEADPGESNICDQGIFEQGFYTRVACTTLDSLSPLDDEFYLLVNSSGNRNANDDFVPNGLYQPDDNFALVVPRNDVVVSAFSLNRVPSLPDCAPGCTDKYNERREDVFAPYRDPGETDADFIGGAPINDNGTPDDASDDFVDTGSAQIMVTGRFPSNANECANDPSDVRDPFDIDRQNDLDTWEIDEVRQVILNDGFTLFDAGNPATTDKNVRGFALTGRWVTQDNCIGSEWGVRRIEKLVNLPGVYESEVEQLPDQQGLVLVEVMYRHELLLDLPLFGGIFNMFGSGGGQDSGYIMVWAAFPLPTVRFDLNFERDCDDLLLFDTVTDGVPYSAPPRDGADAGSNCSLIPN